MSMYVMRERLDSEEIEEILDCCRSIRNKLIIQHIQRCEWFLRLDEKN